MMGKNCAMPPRIIKTPAARLTIRLERDVPCQQSNWKFGSRRSAWCLHLRSRSSNGCTRWGTRAELRLDGVRGTYKMSEKSMVAELGEATTSRM